jgi:hypothetical protein
MFSASVSASIRMTAVCANRYRAKCRCATDTLATGLRQQGDARVPAVRLWANCLAQLGARAPEAAVARV